jgi:hypothetical protein
MFTGVECTEGTATRARELHDLLRPREHGTPWVKGTDERTWERETEVHDHCCKAHGSKQTEQWVSQQNYRQVRNLSPTVQSPPSIPQFLCLKKLA